MCFLHALCNRLCLSSASFFVVSPSPERRNLQEWKRMKTFLMCFQRIVRHNSYILDRICPIKTHALTLTLHHITVSTTQPDPYCDPYIYIYTSYYIIKKKRAPSNDIKWRSSRAFLLITPVDSPVNGQQNTSNYIKLLQVYGNVAAWCNMTHAPAFFGELSFSCKVLLLSIPQTWSPITWPTPTLYMHHIFVYTWWQSIIQSICFKKIYKYPSLSSIVCV